MEAFPSAFLCICLTSISPLYSIFNSDGIRETGKEFSGTNSILVAVAHLSHTLMWLYKQRKIQDDHVLSRELEKNEHPTAQSVNGNISHHEFNVENISSVMSFVCGSKSSS